LAGAVVAIGALVVGLVTAVSVLGGATKAGANPIGASPGLYVSGGSLAHCTLATVSGCASSTVAGMPGQPVTALAINSTAQKALVGFNQDNPVVGLGLVDVATNTVTATDFIQVRGLIVGIAMDPKNPNGGYVATQTAIYSVAISGSSFGAIAPLAQLPHTPTTLAISPDGRMLYVGWQLFTDTTSQFGVDAVPVGNPLQVTTWNSPQSQPVNDLAVSPDGSHLYGAQGSGRTGDVFDLPLPLSVGETQPPGWPVRTNLDAAVAVTVNASGSRIYVGGRPASTSQNSTVFAVDPSTGKVLGTVPVPIHVNANLAGGLAGIAVSPDGGTLTAVGTDGAAPNLNVTEIYPVDLNSLSGPPSPTQLPTSFGATSGPQDVAITPDQAPIADFTSHPANAGSSTTFDAAAPSSVRYGSITNYSWDFGDGTTGSGPTPSHVYATSATFSVTLTETDSAGTSVPAGSCPGTPNAVTTSGQTPYANASCSATISHNVPIPSPTGTPPPPPTTTTTPPHGTTTVPGHPAHNIPTTTTVPGHHVPGTPYLILNPAIGPPGTIVTVTGSGFARNAPVTVSWSVSSGSVVITADGHGNLPPASLYILTPDVLGPRLAEASSTPKSTAQFLVVPGQSEPGGDVAGFLFRSEGP
jgi:hypothetical protein